MAVKVLFIINSLVKKRKKREIVHAIENLLDTSKIKFHIKFTEYGGHAGDLTRQNFGQYDVFVAVGGDGTVNEIAKNLVGTSKILGIIPAGSGNGFARSLGISVNFSKAVRKINDLQIKMTDTAMLGEIPFINMAGTGFDAVVADKFSHFGKRGFISYFLLSAREFLIYKPLTYKMETDGRIIEFSAFLIEFANATQFGYNAIISPNSALDDGYLEVCILKKFPLLILPGLALMLFSGIIDKTRYMEVIKAKKVILMTNENLPFHIDGEPVHSKPVPVITIVPSSLKVLV